jgi:flagellar P-ring protein precursor FlgI
MMMLKRLWLLFSMLLVATVVAQEVRAERLGEIADFAGVRDNQLLGYGLVVGLDGTGDQTMQAPFTSQSLTNMLSQLGVTVPPGLNMQLRNIAAVVVTADLPAFARPGQRLDVVVSSIGNARSLRGGTLLMSPLRGADGEVYALAQGNLLIGGASAQAAGSSVQINQQSGGRIAGGALVERGVPLALGDAPLELQLRQASFTTAQRTAGAINQAFGNGTARALDGSVILLQGPVGSDAMVNFMAQVENIEITPADPAAKVVINSRTGSVVLTSRVSLHPAAVAHGSLSIVIDNQFQVSQPPPFSGGETVVVPDADISIEQGEGALRMVEGADLQDVVRALNALGATPQDLMSILEALRAAGSLRAELEIL